MSETGHGGLCQSPSNVLTWNASLTVAHCLVIATALFRLYRRKITKSLWWDDTFAAIGLLLDFIYLPTLWLRNNCYVGHDVTDAEKRRLVTANWIAQVVFPLLLWSTRASLALSTARFVPTKHVLQWLCGVLACIFVAFGIGTTVQVTIACGWDHPEWKNTPPFQCPIQEEAAIARITLDTMADIALVAIPSFAFWRVSRLPPVSRRLIKACFTASLLVTAVGIGAAATLFIKKESQSKEQQSQAPFIAVVTCHLIITTSILVCNMLVVVTSIYRVFRSHEDIKPIGAPDQPEPAVDIAVVDSKASASATPSSGAIPITTTSSGLSTNHGYSSGIPMNSIYSGHLTTIYESTHCSSDSSKLSNESISQVPRRQLPEVTLSSAV